MSATVRRVRDFLAVLVIATVVTIVRLLGEGEDDE